MFRKLSFLVFLFLCSNLLGQQNTRIELVFSEKTILVGNNFTITAVVYDPVNGSAPVFPTIKGFDKYPISSGQQTTIVNGKVTSFLKFEQTYKSLSPGTFRLPAFVLNVGGGKVSHNGFNIKVNKIPGFEDDTFLELRAVKSNVYKGEPFQLELSIWYSKENAKKMQFGNHTTQKVDEFKKYFSSKAIWVEYITETGLGSRKLPNGKQVYGTRVMTMLVVPQSSGTLHFDALEIDMIKKIKNYGRVDKKYRSKPLDIKVKELPYSTNFQDPIVGAYEGKDELSEINIQTGEEAVYTFEIEGEGNLPFLESPVFKENDSLLIVKSNEDLNMVTKSQTIKGKKTFTYSLIPQAPGEYNLDEFFKLNVFDFKTEKYKVISGTKVLKVTGKNFLEKQKVAETPMVVTETRDFEPIFNQNDELVSIDRSEKLNIVTNLLLLLFIACLLFLIIKSYKQRTKTNEDEQ